MQKYLACFLLISVMLMPHTARGSSIEWSGLQWIVRDDTGGPGPNTFSPKNVFVSSDGSLHLKISRSGAHWSCAELQTADAFEYGTYQFSVLTRVDQLDQNVVFGMFSYPNADVGPDGTNELDIEFSHWGDSSFPIGNFTAWPTVLNDDNAATTFDFSLHKTNTTQQYAWRPGSVEFKTFRGFTASNADLIAGWITPPSFAHLVSRHAMPVHINLWLFDSQPPTNAQPVEMILKSFSFKKA